MEADRIAVKPFAISLTGLIAVESGGALLPVTCPGLPSMGVLLGLRMLEILMFFGIVSIWGDGLPSVGLTKTLFRSGFARGIRWSLIFGAVAAGGFAILIIAGINPLKLVHVNLPKAPLQIVAFFTAGALIGPLAEEIFFRAILYGFLRRWGILPALVISNLMFVLMHPLAGSIPVPQIVGGIVFTLAYEIKGELMAPVTIHILGNTALFSLSLLA
ncbi:MAG: CPBP family intramembrane metalloprotease [Deltaproteobacteria bacterium]|nr:CPBP family intramembrane metalloprotease [Deltaproteobacteria bacterium]